MSDGALYLIRHGAAGEARIDRERGLTESGRREVEALAEGLEQRGVRVERILHSGYRRARETAEILARLGSTSPRQSPSLTPDDDPDVLIAELADLGGSTLVVSHLPFLPHLCEELLEDLTELPRFGTASAVRLDPVKESRGHGEWRVAWQIDGRDVLAGDAG